MIVLCLLAGVCKPSAALSAQPESPFQVRSHELTVQLFPHEHRIHAIDRMTLQANTQGTDRLSLELNPNLRIEHVRLLTASGPLPLTIVRTDAQASVSVQLASMPSRDQLLTLEWEYAGVINEPPRDPRHLRFVTPSETAGHIGDEGVYLSGETHWYPSLEGQFATFRLSVTVPEGWTTVSHGRQTGQGAAAFGGKSDRTEVWDVDTKTEALTLVANRFVKGRRDWKGIELATYLFPDDAKLSDEYLEAAVRYLEVYTRRLGPYPFPKFAVVENFFASGLGMPSFTLLGSGVIKRHYVQPYALGHEIVHSWFGNSVFNDTNRGNWVEGLTTYLANYYYDELTGTAEQARDQRRLMLLGYAVYVPPSEDYPVGRFTHKTSQKDNAVGYQKSAMIFHMLRNEVGEEAFWLGIRRLVQERTGTFSAWKDLERIFSQAAGKDVRWFFAQWVERAGAAEIKIANARVRPSAQAAAGGGFSVELVVRQSDPMFRVRLPISIRLADGREEKTFIHLDKLEQSFTIPVAAHPLRLRLDPELTIFRRLDRAKIPPMLNLFVTDPERVVVIPSGGGEKERAPYEELAARVMAMDSGAGTSTPTPRVTRVMDRDAIETDGLPKVSGSVLVLGPPGVNLAAARAAERCDPAVSIGNGRFTVEGQTFEKSDHALLLSCRSPDRPGHVITLFFGHSLEAAAKVGRLLFFYGWQSYLVFQDGAVIARGDFTDMPDELEVRLDAQ